MSELSRWRTAKIPRFASAPLPREVDVAVIGAGVTGLTAAYLLKRAGKRVAVFDRTGVGAGETGNTSAHLTYVTDARLSDLVQRFGRETAAHVWGGGAEAIDQIEATVAELNIACGFQRVPGALSAPISRDDDDEARRLVEEAALASELGFHAHFAMHGPLRGRPAILFADQALFHPLQYLSALALTVHGDGSWVGDECEIGDVMTDPRAVIVNGETVACDYVIIATHVPLMGATGLVSATLFQTKLYPYSTYVLGARLPHGSMAPGLYSDTSDPYFYLRVHDAGDHLYAIFGGEDHKTGHVSDTEACYARLADTFRLLCPDAVIDARWSGQVIETSDGLPFMGETAERQFVATGYAGNGLTFGTLAGRMAYDAVLGHPNPWTHIFNPRRRTIGGLGTIVAENVDYPRYLATDWLRTSVQTETDDIAPGDGKVITLDGSRVACHRTQKGELLAVSAVCTHLGCLVHWNHAEQTWDCPCHGSRFSPHGAVLGGPAEAPLAPVDL